MNRFEDLVKSNPEFFEDQVIACFLASREFTQNYAPSIIEYNMALRGRHKLSQNKNRVIFDGIMTFREANSSADLVPRTWIDDYVTNAQEQGRLLPAEVATVAQHLDHLYERATDTTVSTIDGAPFKTWFDVSLSEDIVKYVTNNESDVSITDIKSMIANVENIAPEDEDSSVVSFDQAMMHDKGHNIANAVSSIGKLNTAMGGGFRMGESTLIAGATGGGKTVMAAMLAMDFCQAGRKTVFVTTEQKPYEILPRIFSNRCSIPMDKFEEMGEGCILPPAVTNVPDYMINVAATRNTFSETLKFLDWSNASGKTAEDDLERELLKLKESFDFDCVLFDWVGGALSRTRDSLREVYLDAANTLHDLAKRHNWIVVMFAQLNKRLCSGKKYCNSTMLAECTAMADNASNAIYISALRSSEDSDAATSYNELQYFNVDKARKGQTGRFQIVRDFRYQRFIEPHLQAAARSAVASDSSHHLASR